MTGKNRRDVLSMLGVGGATVLAGRVAVGASDPEDDSRARTQARYFPNVELVTHEGKKVRFYDDLVKDKIVLINFMYAECVGICPGITANLQRVQKLLGDRVGRDIFMYSITLTPEKDNPAALKHYVEMHKIKPGWTFLTGKPDDIELLRRRLGFYTSNQKNDKDKTNHIGMVRYGNEPRQWWGMCPGQAKADWIVESIHWMDEPKRQTTTTEAKS
ncbi:MAG TPA: SCO family protein [Pyrinomonadaceae bacterium]|jgi:protein SCO1/2|nr:SCO family protein [Pyrinomonadaceae bacterium]